MDFVWSIRPSPRPMFPKEAFQGAFSLSRSLSLSLFFFFRGVRREGSTPPPRAHGPLSLALSLSLSLSLSRLSAPLCHMWPRHVPVLLPSRRALPSIATAPAGCYEELRLLQVYASSASGCWLRARLTKSPPSSARCHLQGSRWPSCCHRSLP